MIIAQRTRQVVRNRTNFMRAKQAAQHFGIAHSTLWLWVKSKDGFPQPIKASSRVTLFDVDAIEKFLRGSNPLEVV